MTFKIDHNDTFSDLVAEGEYEVYVKSAKEAVTKNGVPHIAIDLLIREDFAQSHKKCYIFAKLWKGKESFQYNMQQINTIGKALNIPNGKEYPNLEALLADFIGKCCRVRVKHEEYNGYTNVKVASWNPSKINPYIGGTLGEEVPFNENDCPF